MALFVSFDCVPWQQSYDKSMAKFVLAFTLIPIVEMFLLILLGDALGFWGTVSLVLITGIVGGALAKSEGLRVLRKWQGSLARGEMPEEGVVGGLLVLIGGVLLITPGVLTDVAGLLLLIPATRRWLAARIAKSVERRIQDGRIRVVATSTVGFDGRNVQAFRSSSDVTRPGPVVVDCEVLPK